MLAFWPMEIVETGWVVEGRRVVVARDLGGPAFFKGKTILLVEDTGSEAENRKVAESAANFFGPDCDLGITKKT